MGVGEQQGSEQGMILWELRETQPEVFSPNLPFAGENTIAQISIALLLWVPLYILPSVRGYWRLMIKLCHLKYLSTPGVVMLQIMKTKGNIQI